MMAHTGPSPRHPELRHQSRAWIPVGAILMVGLLLNACSRPAAAPQVPDMVAVTDTTVIDPTAASTSADEDPSLPDAPELPVAPGGEAPLEDLEILMSEALALAGEGELDLARDRLFTLQELVLAPLPADSDSLYVLHRRSLARRLTFLGGLLAEQRAYAGPPARADSVLTREYLALEAVAMPDSLVPATGTHLPPLQADLLKVHNGQVEKWIEYFTGRGRRHFALWLERKAAVDSLVTSILEQHDLPPELIYLAMIESGLSSRARSSVGAVGPWQFMPGTAKMNGLATSWWLDERRDLEMSTHAAARYLKRLHDEFGDWALVLAAYNSGEGRVRRQIRLTGHTDYWQHRLPRQTVNYVPKFIAAARIGEDPAAYGFAIDPPRPLAYETLPVDDATDLGLIAECAGVDRARVLALNPGLLREATPPGVKAYPVRVPSGTAARAARELRKVPSDQRLTWRRHRVERGETLSQIASRYGTSVRDIVRVNKMRDANLIRPGDQLLIPMPAELRESAQARAKEKGHYVPPAGYERVAYRVRQGDTLGHIARRLGVSVRHLRKVNGLHGDLIKPGQSLYAYRPPA